MTISTASSGIDSAQLATFAAVIEEGGFDAAARRLHVTPSAVSQRIKALEQRLGQVLVRRSKPVRPTAAGEALVRLAGQVALLESEAMRAVRGDPTADEPVRMPVAVNADSLVSWFLPALAELEFDQLLTFDLHAEDQDHSAALLRDGSVMAAVTADPRAVQGCRVQRLGSMRYLGMCTPAYLNRWLPAGPQADDLARAPMLVFNRKDALQERFLRTLSRRRLSPPVHYVPSPWAFIEAVRLGLGWGMVPEEIGRSNGTLVEFAAGRHVDVPLYWQHWKLESAALTALTESVRRTAGRALR
jgi:LysR family transcriptional regulator (chromosome initiation inhibitor)